MRVAKMHGPFGARIAYLQIKLAGHEKRKLSPWPSGSAELRWHRVYVKHARELLALLRRAHAWHNATRQWSGYNRIKHPQPQREGLPNHAK